MENSSFREKVQQLEKELAKNAKSLEEAVNPSSGAGMSWMTISAIATPIIAFLGLYLLSPGFVCTGPVKNSKNKKSVRSTKRVFLYSLGISVLVWLSMYTYTSYFPKA
jgi:uncharacterized membrane protein